MTGEKNVILFDGVCNLCTGSVKFIIKRDPRSIFKFASLQSSIAEQILYARGYDEVPSETIVYIKDMQIFHRSRAALEIVKRLSGAWPMLYVFIIIPPFIRDAVYDLIARYRYRWFGQKDECMVPTPDIASRFLD